MNYPDDFGYCDTCGRPPGRACLDMRYALCWCGENYVWVSPRDVREGVTGLCGLRGCAAPKEAA